MHRDGSDMLEKTYNPAAIEARVREAWEKADAFKAGRRDRAAAQPFSIVIPPPNVTGSLHMGHALNNTLQDVLCRYERMRGRDVLWQPGTDHAGIATQMVVERQLAASGEPNRRALGRDAFIRRVWAWKEESGGTITNQLKRLGASCDWSRERFTMDAGLSEAVIKVFVDLYRAGLIYRDKRLVNWDPKFQTAISDLEVVQKEVDGHLWHLRYPLKDDPSQHIVVATTRPETMLGDSGIAVHPEDERYRHLVGKRVVLPLVGREIRIVADEYSDPEKGSGAVKITPAHDFNDFEIGKRHRLAQINIFDAFARLNDEVPEAYRGLDRFEARRRVVADLESLGFLAKVEAQRHVVPHGDRSDVPIEPWLTDQWYVDAKALAKAAIEAVESGRTVFVPKAWEKTYFDWMRNIQPWCISRQLWWGHQIPAWYGPDGEVFVAETEHLAEAAAARHYDARVALRRDEDVLDTWFSSALWPFSTLGWPERTPELARYYPTSVLVTGFDIIFFWVARMMMMGLYFQKEVPFRTVYIHALVRDERGQKMSKSKGNAMDPLELIDEFGADALRFTLAAMAAQGRDIKLAKARVEGYRNFATKLWNAARFAEMNGCARVEGFDPDSVRASVNRWIVSETRSVVEAVMGALEAYKFNEAASAIYEFTWGLFCDWYVELIKPILTGDDEPAKAETRAMTNWVLDNVLKLLHPFMPFITEELWAHLAAQGGRGDTLLALSAWPQDLPERDETAVAEMGWVVALVSEIRSVRAELNVPPGAMIPLVALGADAGTRDRTARHEETIKRLARLASITQAGAAPHGAVLITVGDTSFALPLAGVIDTSVERGRLRKEVERTSAEAAKIETKLANEQFLAKAPEEVVEEQRTRKADLERQAGRLRAALKRLEG
jgi:valyl-tRNA synthetase